MQCKNFKFHLATAHMEGVISVYTKGFKSDPHRHNGEMKHTSHKI